MGKTTCGLLCLLSVQHTHSPCYSRPGGLDITPCNYHDRITAACVFVRLMRFGVCWIVRQQANEESEEEEEEDDEDMIELRRMQMKRR